MTTPAQLALLPSRVVHARAGTNPAVVLCSNDIANLHPVPVVSAISVSLDGGTISTDVELIAIADRHNSLLRLFKLVELATNCTDDPVLAVGL